MELRGIKPEKIEKRLKALFYGCAGSGKTMASIQFPKPYMIDTERGAENDEYVEMLKKQGGVIFQTSDFDEIMSEVKVLMSTEHDFKTLIIDPITLVYDNLIENSEKFLKDKDPDKDPTAFGRNYGRANKQFKKLMRLLTRIDMNVIITSHSKNTYGEKLQVLGQTFDAYKKMDYPFDLILEIRRFGSQRKAKVKKTRIKGLPEDTDFSFSYDYIAEQYGRGVLEKTSEKQTLATEAQIKEAKRFIRQLMVPSHVVDKWLKKANSSALCEMEGSKIQSCIDYMKGKLHITGETE
jgi:hypothetical protein